MWSSRQITLSRVVWNILRHPLMLPTILLLMTYKVLCQRPFGVFLKIQPNLRLRSSLISPTHFLHLFIFSNLFRTSTYLCPGWVFNWRGCHFFETCWGSFSRVQSLNCQNILLKTISSYDDVWNLLRFVLKSSKFIFSKSFIGNYFFIWYDDVTGWRSSVNSGGAGITHGPCQGGPHCPSRQVGREDNHDDEIIMRIIGAITFNHQVGGGQSTSLTLASCFHTKTLPLSRPGPTSYDYDVYMIFIWYDDFMISWYDMVQIKLLITCTA